VSLHSIQILVLVSSQAWGRSQICYVISTFKIAVSVIPEHPRVCSQCPHLPVQSFLMLRPTLCLRVASQASRALATHASPPPSIPSPKHLWTRQEIQQIYDGPLLDLVFRAASVHRQHQDPSKIQLCTLLNIKSALS
jgi:hypothetical protein